MSLREVARTSPLSVPSMERYVTYPSLGPVARALGTAITADHPLHIPFKLRDLLAVESDGARGNSPTVQECISSFSAIASLATSVDPANMKAFETALTDPRVWKGAGMRRARRARTVFGPSILRSSVLSFGEFARMTPELRARVVDEPDALVVRLAHLFQRHLGGFGMDFAATSASDLEKPDAGDDWLRASYAHTLNLATAALPCITGSGFDPARVGPVAWDSPALRGTAIAAAFAAVDTETADQDEADDEAAPSVDGLLDLHELSWGGGEAPYAASVLYDAQFYTLVQMAGLTSAAPQSLFGLDKLGIDNSFVRNFAMRELFSCAKASCITLAWALQPYLYYDALLTVVLHDPTVKAALIQHLSPRALSIVYDMWPYMIRNGVRPATTRKAVETGPADYLVPLAPLYRHALGHFGQLSAGKNHSMSFGGRVSAMFGVLPEFGAGSLLFTATQFGYPGKIDSMVNLAAQLNWSRPDRAFPDLADLDKPAAAPTDYASYVRYMFHTLIANRRFLAELMAGGTTAETASMLSITNTYAHLAARCEWKAPAFGSAITPDLFTPVPVGTDGLTWQVPPKSEAAALDGPRVPYDKVHGPDSVLRTSGPTVDLDVALQARRVGVYMPTSLGKWQLDHLSLQVDPRTIGGVGNDLPIPAVVSGDTDIIYENALSHIALLCGVTYDEIIDVIKRHPEFFSHLGKLEDGIWKPTCTQVAVTEVSRLRLSTRRVIADRLLSDDSLILVEGRVLGLAPVLSERVYVDPIPPAPGGTALEVLRSAAAAVAAPVRRVESSTPPAVLASAAVAAPAAAAPVSPVTA